MNPDTGQTGQDTAAQTSGYAPAALPQNEITIPRDSQPATGMPQPVPAAPQQPAYTPPAPAAQVPQQPAYNYTPQQAPPPPDYSHYTAPAPPTVTNAPAAGAQLAKSNPNSTQNTLQIADIRDGIMIMNDGSFRSIIMAKSINFDLMSPQEREGVESGYQGFLNSLYFPIQIFVRSQKVDLRPYLEKLDKIRGEHDNMLLALLMDDYIGFMDQLSQQTNIMDKRFYIVVPYFAKVDVQKAITQSKNFFSGLTAMFNNKENHVVINEKDLEDAKTELRNRVQATLAGLLQCGVQGLPLDTQELIELMYETYNPDTATRQQLKNFDELTAPVVQKGVGMAPQPNLDRDLG